MKMSRRAARMQRRHKRNKGSGLNLTALMDIFTILVFFLMVNQSDGVVPTSDSIQLPASISENEPKENIVIMISKEDIVVQGRFIASTSKLLQSQEDIIPELKTELDYLATRTPVNAAAPEKGRPITIMGDKEIGYSLLKKVMSTCAKSGFNDISLAVNQTQLGGS